MASVWRGSLTARIYSKSLKTTLEIGFIQTKQETKEILCSSWFEQPEYGVGECAK
jgi:hypothetical protein